MSTCDVLYDIYEDISIPGQACSSLRSDVFRDIYSDSKLRGLRQHLGDLHCTLLLTHVLEKVHQITSSWVLC